MRQVHVFQPPGDANALGRVKFLFPNKHDVYLHDTPSKGLFASTSRAFSHGCVRVRDPLKLAEVILAADKNMSRVEIDKLANSGPENNEVKLGAPIPIHLTYFTASVDDEGKLHLYNDVYGHEQRVHLGLEGKTHLIVQPREEKFTPPSAEERRRYAEQRQQKQATPVENFFKGIFNF
jgi:murein L,D-transpeptidase YcbB/YkuD